MRDVRSAVVSKKSEIKYECKGERDRSVNVLGRRRVGKMSGLCLSRHQANFFGNLEGGFQVVDLTKCVFQIGKFLFASMVMG